MHRLGLTSLCLVGACLLPRVASATKSSELYTSSPYGYGRFETRIRFAAGDGVVSAFFLWKDGSEVAGTFWNELDYEKIDADCKLATNALYGNPAANHTKQPGVSADFCSGFHVYAYEWTADYVAWSFDGAEVRRETGETATAFAENASAGMQIHFNIWPGDSTFGGTLNPSTLPVHQYIDWVQFSSYADGAFTLAWREDFSAATIPTGWLTGNWDSPKGLSTHDAANVNFLNGCAVLSLTADDATGPTGAMPDPTGGTGGMSGSGGAAGASAQGGMAGTAAGASTGGASGGGGTEPGGNGGADASGATGGASGATGGASGATGGAGGTTGPGGTGGTTGGTGAVAAGASGGASSAGTSGTPGASGGATGGDSTVGGSSAGGNPASGASGGAEAAAGQGAKDDDGGGCGCRVPGSTRSSQRGQLVGAGLVLALAGAFRRRRASRASRARG